MRTPTRTHVTNQSPGQGNGNPARMGQSSRNSERGTEILEFAFVISLLMTLLLGIVTFARAYNVYQTITRPI